MPRILIVEDEPRISSFVEKGLNANGFVTRTVVDGHSALEAGRSGDYELIILDIGLPLLDGLAVLRQLRTDGISTPVIILTARDTVADTVAGIEGGADDYMRKPFAFDELLARVRLRLRSAGSTEHSILRAGGLALDMRTRRADVDGRIVDLSAREFSLAEVFIRHQDHVLSREQLLSQVWGFDFDPGSNVVDVYVRYLRKKIGEARIETVRGSGYRLLAR